MLTSVKILNLKDAIAKRRRQKTCAVRHMLAGHHAPVRTYALYKDIGVMQCCRQPCCQHWVEPANASRPFAFTVTTA